MNKSITEIATEAISTYPGWAVKSGYLIELGKKYNVSPIEIHRKMVDLANNEHYCHACGNAE